MISTIGCSPIAVYSHEFLNVLDIESSIALADVEDKNSYGHVYLIIDNKPIEPRYLGFYLQDNIRYHNPYNIYNSTEDYLSNGHTIFPTANTIVNAISELRTTTFI